MQKLLTKHGNSLALIIDKAVLELLNISPTTTLDITTDGDALIIRPVRKGKHNRQKMIDSALNEVNRQYKKSLKKLSE